MDKDFDFGKTFASAFKEWKALRESESGGTLASTDMVKAFADWLDRTKFITPILALLGMTEARKVDHEMMQALIEEVGEDRAKEIIAPIAARYRDVGKQG